MSKGGSTSTEIELPPELEAFANQNLDLAKLVGTLGFMPYQGPTVAGFAPQQMAAMKGTDQMASAFGMPSAVNWGGRQGTKKPPGMSQNDLYTALTGMQPPNASMGGFSGYSGFPGYEEAVAGMPAGQRELIQSLFIDPVTGKGPTNKLFKKKKKKRKPDIDMSRSTAFGSSEGDR